MASLIGKSLGWIKHWTVKGRVRSLFNIYKKTTFDQRIRQVTCQDFQPATKRY